MNSIINAHDNVDTKRDTKSHRIYEKHPNLMFGIILLIWGTFILFFNVFIGNDTILDNYVLYACSNYDLVH